MARKNKNVTAKRNDRIQAIMMVARAMNLRTVDEYKNWCTNNGFSTAVNKSKSQLDREYLYYKSLTATKRLKQYKRESNLCALIQKIYTGEINYKELNSEVLRIISQGLKNASNKRVLRDVLIYMEETSKFLDYPKYTRGIISLVAFKTKWIRPLEEWKVKTHNVERQFASLARHLFAMYEIPYFMDSVWFSGTGKEKGWFIHIGRGNNIRSAPSLPIKMTKKMAYNFIQAPDSYDVKSAFRWAQIQALGGNNSMADAIRDTRMTREFKDNEFWLSVLRFLLIIQCWI